MAIRQARFSHRAGLVSIDCNDHAASRAEPVVAAPGIQETAGAARAMTRGQQSPCSTAGPDIARTGGIYRGPFERQATEFDRIAAAERGSVIPRRANRLIRGRIEACEVIPGRI